jgi:hypothetical protein
MITNIVRFTAASLLVAALAFLPNQAAAQTQTKTNKTEKKIQSTEPTAGKQTSGPFHGKLAALDKAAKTITVGKRTFQVTSSTKIFKAGNPATLNDGVVGEVCSGGFKTDESGRLVATKVTFGPKPETKTEEKATPTTQPGKQKTAS